MTDSPVEIKGNSHPIEPDPPVVTGGKSWDLDRLRQYLAETDRQMKEFRESQRIDPATLYRPFTI
ncbi:MAG: hypothetical protein H7836_07275 [Magnetococcus sp. YQC-3]